MRFYSLYIFAASIFSYFAVQGQNAQSAYNLKERPKTTAQVISSKPVIDGDVLNEELWMQMKAFGDLIQTQPKAGVPASEKTDIRIAIDDRNFYLSVVCYDSNPEKIVVTDARRDASLDATDAFMFILDTYHDNRNGFLFGTNSIGVQHDAQIDNEGQGNFNNNRQQGGTIGGFNLNWDASWEVAAKVGEFGWSAEFAIPLSTLRFAPGENMTWGINFRRNIQKTNEFAYWSPMPIEFNLYRLSLAGDLVGLNLKKPGNLKFIPYALVSTDQDFASTDRSFKTDAEIGADIKYSVTPNMTLDLTYNTDFAQVEVDEQQVNLDRFNLFFPEKRPFFLENAGLFSVGSPGEVDLFFSRRIGIGPNGEQVPIIGGARLSGKMKNTNIGLLNMYTDDVSENGIDKNSFAIARVNHDFQGRTSLGAIFVNRSGINSELEDDYNNTFAVDGKFGLGKKAQLSGYYAKTSTPGISESDHSYKFQSNYEWSGWNIRAGYTEVGEGFNPEAGFLFRKAFRKPEFLILYKLRAPASSPFLEFRPHISYRGYWNLQGFQESGFLHIDNHWQWKSGTEVHSGLNLTKEGVVTSFEIAKGVVIPSGTYDHAEALIVFFTNQNKPFAISTRHTLGGFFGGKRYSNSATIFARVGDKFTSEWGISHNDIRLPFGKFNTTVLKSRISYSFTPNIFLQGLLQYNSVTDSFSSNIRFGWLKQANTGLFIVYNDARADGLISDRNIVLKYSILFDVLK